MRLGSEIVDFAGADLVEDAPKGRAVGEIASAVGDVAQGAERQVRMGTSWPAGEEKNAPAPSTMSTSVRARP